MARTELTDDVGPLGGAFGREERAPVSDGTVDVVLVRWPEESERLERLRAAGTPRLLLVGEDGLPPDLVDPLEDWIRLPAAETDLRARVTTLAARGGAVRSGPHVDADGLLRYRGRWVTLSPVERALAAALVDRFGAVVGRDTLLRRAWPGGTPTRNALDVHMLRLRRRISELGLQVRTVRARGYVLQAVDESAWGPGYAPPA